MHVWMLILMDTDEEMMMVWIWVEELDWIEINWYEYGFKKFVELVVWI